MSLTDGLCNELWLPLGASQVALVVKNPPASAGDRRDVSLFPALCFPLLYYCFHRWTKPGQASAKCWSKRSRWAFKRIVKTLGQKWVGAFPPGLGKIAGFRVLQTPKISVGLISGLGRSPGEGQGNPLQYSCLEKPMDRGAWWARVAKSQLWLKRLSTRTRTGLPLEAGGQPGLAA